MAAAVPCVLFAACFLSVAGMWQPLTALGTEAFTGLFAVNQHCSSSAPGVCLELPVHAMVPWLCSTVGHVSLVLGDQDGMFSDLMVVTVEVGPGSAGASSDLPCVILAHPQEGHALLVFCAEFHPQLLADSAGHKGGFLSKVMASLDSSHKKVLQVCHIQVYSRLDGSTVMRDMRSVLQLMQHGSRHSPRTSILHVHVWKKQKQAEMQKWLPC